MRRGIAVRTGEAPEIEAFLVQRICEYNASVTGYHDAEVFTAIHESAPGVVEAGMCGYTWGGCCYVCNLWVSESSRGEGLGTELLETAERHARQKGCRVILLSSHSFQAPEFYARMGFAQVARISDHPIGHASIFFSKRLAG